MFELVTQLSLYFNTPLTEALNLPVSIFDGVLKTKSFEGWKENRLHDAKAIAGINERLNGVIRVVNNLSKITANKR